MEHSLDPLVLSGRLIGLLERVATAKRPCRLCGEMLYFVPIDGIPVPYTKDANVHDKISCSGYVRKPGG